MRHLLLVGDAGVGKTVLSVFVSWMNSLTTVRVGVEGEKVCFILDESNAMSSAFLERMNALLASVFEGEDLIHLMTAY
jgi:dynein heavy chain 1, cytosolic